MKIAFHFNADAEEYKNKNYAIATEKKIFKALLDSELEPIHLKFFHGDLLFHTLLRDGVKNWDKIVEELIGESNVSWCHMDANYNFITCAGRVNIFTVAIEGISMEQRDYLATFFEGDETYLGALDIFEGNSTHWALYNHYLIPAYRLINEELRLIYSGAEEDRDDGLLEFWKEEHLFQIVTWEEHIFRHTIFDSYDTFRHAKRGAELSKMLSDLSSVADDVMLRLSDLNPKMHDILYAALRTFNIAETVEDVAQVSLSCRRFIERLANTLYPPRSELVDGRKVDKPAYRNRLFAYISESLSKEDIEQFKNRLDLLGKRVYDLDNMANEGLHADLEKTVVKSLIVDLLEVTYEILWLRPPSDKVYGIFD